ncbi:MAG TPA: diacylglycerol kinase family protein, partial [Candidatus Saccharimonadales bacterium]|nr:diacylglycerol kinase family protein [Candidatus Saccharimonadales bacterium]
MYYYIINPAAGKSSINSLQQKLRERLGALGIGGEFAKTTGPGDATKMASAAIEKGYTTIVAVGGDGTVNEIINGITQESVAVGIIPLGTSNTLAKHFGINSWQQACTVLASRRISTYNLMAAGKNYFLSSLSLGFETELDKTVDSPDSRLSSRLKHLSKSWGQARSHPTLECHLELDNLEIDCTVFSLIVSNQKFQNPLLENRMVVNIAEKPSPRQLSSYLVARFRGQMVHEDHATTRVYGTKLTIDAKPGASIMIDGKVAGRTPIAI